MFSIQGSTKIASSCTIFTAAIGETVFFGNNEDYKLNNAYRWYVPAQNITTTYYGDQEIYGAVFVGFANNNDTNVDNWEQGGMNEHGLCFDANGLPDILMNHNLTASYPYTSHALAQILWDCRDVSEVIDWYKTHSWSGYFGGNIHYADSNGDAVVVSVNATGHWVFTLKDSSFLVSTNFNLVDTTHGYYPCSRYDTATQMFSEILAEEDLTVSKCAEVLYAVHQEGMYGTKYSNVFDPVNLDCYFLSGEEFSEYTKFNLLDKLSETDSYEEKNRFMGVYGQDQDFLVKFEKIDIQFETVTDSETKESEVSIMLIILGLTSYVSLVSFMKRRRK
jgi:choloylglycine hydrolase